MLKWIQTLDTGSKVASRASGSSLPSPHALRLQEICDHICDFLHESPADLRACSLVSPVFTSSAQHHLFHVMDLTSGRWWHGRSQATRAARLCSILDHSPHLIRFIRCLMISFEEAVLVKLLHAQLTHVKTIILGSDLHQCPPNSALSLAASLLSSPSVRNLRLLSILFLNLDGLGTLFSQRTSSFDRITLDNVDFVSHTATKQCRAPRTLIVKAIEIQQSQDPGWLVHPHCPFNLSALTDISICRETSPGLIALVRTVRSSLQTLRIDARVETSGLVPAEFPALRRLELFSGFGSVAPVSDLLASFSIDSDRTLPLEHLTIRIALLGTLSIDDESLLRLDAVIAGLNAPWLQHVHLLVSKAGIPWPKSAPEYQGTGRRADFLGTVLALRALFPLLENVRGPGCLKLSCIDDRIQTDL